MAATQQNLKIVQNETFVWDFVIYQDDEATTPYDLSTATLHAIAKDKSGSPVLKPSSPLDLNPQITNAAAGEGSITLTEAETGLFTTAASTNASTCPDWDFFVLDGVNSTKVFYGCIEVELSCTDPTP